MTNFLAVLAVVLCLLAMDHVSSAADRRQSRENTRTKEKRVSRSKHQRGVISIARQIPPEIPELPPVLETNIFTPTNGMGSRRTRCKEIPAQFSLCYNMQYTKMHLPNLRGHDSIDELVKQSNEWTPLLRTRCHPETQKFLCSVFAPVCVEDIPDPIPPCRSLCESVRDGCSPAMARYSYPWPRMLNCSQFPSDDTLCIPTVSKSPAVKLQPTSPAAKVCSPCRRQKITRSFKRKLCSFDFIMRSRVKHVTYQKGNIKLTLDRKSRLVLKWLNNINTRTAKRTMAKKNIVWMTGGKNCTCDVLHEGGKTNYLLAGYNDDGKLRLFSITKWKRSDKKLSKMLRRRRCKAPTTKNKRSDT